MTSRIVPSWPDGLNSSKPEKVSLVTRCSPSRESYSPSQQSRLTAKWLLLTSMAFMSAAPTTKTKGCHLIDTQSTELRHRVTINIPLAMFSLSLRNSSGQFAHCSKVSSLQSAWTSFMKTWLTSSTRWRSANENLSSCRIMSVLSLLVTTTLTKMANGS